MKKLLLLLIVPALAFTTQPPEKAKIKGKMKFSEPTEMVFLSYVLGGQRVTDSVGTSNGKFEITAKIAEPTLASLVIRFKPVDDKSRPRVDRLQLFIEPGKIKITGKDSLKLAKVSGSQSHNTFVAYKKIQEPYDMKGKALDEEYMVHRNNKDEAGMKDVTERFNILFEEMKENVQYPYLMNNPGSPIALYLLDIYGGYDLDAKKIEPIFESLSDKTKLSVSGKAFKGKIEIAKKTGIGVYAMDFTQNDTLGNPVSLSSFKGKYVLIDFWASWCGPCRTESPNLVKAFHAYKDKGFTVLGVSLDRAGKKQDWLDAIHKDGLEWTQVSELNFWDNAAAKQYGIRGIPSNFLIDPEGKIVAKNIRGEALNETLSKFLK